MLVSQGQSLALLARVPLIEKSLAPVGQSWHIRVGQEETVEESALDSGSVWEKSTVEPDLQAG